MSLIIKMDSIKATEHLSKAIHYIMQEWKTEGMVYSNSGITAEEVVDTFFLTKEKCPSHGNRQGYHYKFSFSKDETISKEDALCFIQKWTEKYLGDKFDYVRSVHHDREHTHMHLVFNSVARAGGKYRYEKGDWEKTIKPLTNELCEKYNSGHLKEKDRQLDYAPAKTLRNIVEKDMEKCLKESDSYEDFKKRMQQDYHYVLREGVSKKHGVYLSLKAPGKANAVRTYTLQEGFTPTEIERKIMERQNKSGDLSVSNIQRKETEMEKQMEKQMFKIFYRRGKSYHDDYKSSRIPYKNLSLYQKRFVKQMLDARRLYRRTGSSLQMHEQSIHAIHNITRDAGLVYDFGIRNPKEIAIALLAVQKEETMTKHKISKMPRGEKKEKEKANLEKQSQTVKELKALVKKEKDSTQEQRKEMKH